MEDFFKQQAGWLSTWQEQQQKLTQQYAQWGEEFTKGVTGAAQQQIPTNVEELLQAQQDLLKQFTGFGGELQQKIQQLWGDKLPAELLRLFNFNILQEFYKSWLGNMKFPGGLQNPFMGGQNWADPSSFLNSFMGKENPFFSAFNSGNLTDNFQQLFGLLQGTKLPGGDLYNQMFTTYQGFFNQLSSTATGQGFDKLLETFTRWQEQTEQYLLAPHVGIHRETAHDFSKAISLTLDYIRSFAVMAKLMEASARKSGNRFQAKLVERSLNNEPPIKFGDFCSLWTKENEAVFLDVFGSEEYAKTQREFTSAGLRLKLQVNKLVEKVLDQTPIALKRDVDLAAKEILQLKRDLRQSRKQHQQLATEVKTAQEAVAASEQRAQTLEASLAKVEQEALAINQRLETSLTKIQQQSLTKIQALEQSLAKVQKLAETAEHTAKATAAQQSKPAAAEKKAAPAAATKRASATTAKKTASTRGTTTTRGTKKPAGAATE